MASVKISQLDPFNVDDLKDENLLIPASKGSDVTKTINVKQLIDSVIADSEHERAQQQTINNQQTQINNQQTQITNIENTLENIDVWDLETFHD